MSEPLPLTPEEDVVFREFTCLDVEPNHIPPELFVGFLERLAKSVDIPRQRVRVATQGLIDKGKFDTVDEGTRNAYTTNVKLSATFFCMIRRYGTC